MIGLLVVLFTLVLFIWLARTTNLIREAGPAVPGKLRPYNLGRTQMAFWFFLVYVSYTVNLADHRLARYHHAIAARVDGNQRRHSLGRSADRFW